MSRPTRLSRMPPLRVRYGASEADIIDIAWSIYPAEINPPSIAILRTGRDYPGGKSTWDVEDPTNPDNDTYPPDEAALLSAVEFVRCAASHWQRVRPRMRRFTETELGNTDFFTGLGGVRSGLDDLVGLRPNDCAYVLEQHPFS